MDTAEASGPGRPLKLDEGYFAARDDLRLYWRSVAPRDPAAVRGHLAIVHGYADHSGRYREVMERMAERGLASYGFDLRGHGQSDGRRSHVEQFGDYLDDLDAFLAHVRRSSEGRPVFLLGHSLGGLICARWALGRRDEVAGLILDAPFLGFAFRPPRIKVLAARALDRVVPWLVLDNGLDIAQLTRDPEVRRETARDPLYLHGATPRWFLETCRVQREVQQRAAEVSLPCLIYAGDGDAIADLATTRRFFEQIGSADKTLKVFEGMLHEPLGELGREAVHAELGSWMDARV